MAAQWSARGWVGDLLISLKAVRCLNELSDDLLDSIARESEESSKYLKTRSVEQCSWPCRLAWFRFRADPLLGKVVTAKLGVGRRLLLRAR